MKEKEIDKIRRKLRKLNQEIKKLNIQEYKSDDRGRITLGSDYANKKIKALIIESIEKEDK